MKRATRVWTSALTFGALMLAGSTTASAHRINSSNQQLNNPQNYRQSNTQVVNQQNQMYPVYHFQNDQNRFRLGSVTKKRPVVRPYVRHHHANHFKISHYFTNRDSSYSKADNQNTAATNNAKADDNQKSSDFSQSHMAKIANAKLGDPYVWGATGANAFDCSGFTQYLYKNGKNVNIPRTAQDQYNYEKHVSYNSIKPGNLVFFGSAPTAISHVGMYIGNGKMIDAQNRGVVIENVKAPWWNLVGCAKVKHHLNLDF